MTLNAQENRECVNILTVEIDTLRATQGVSEKVLALAPYAPWR